MDKNIEELINSTNIKTGLTTQEVEINREKYGKNVLSQNKKINPFIAFLNQFKDFMIILLLIAAVISFGVAFYELYSNKDRSSTEVIISFVEPFIILLVVVLNSMLGAYQEVKSDQAVRALEKINEQNAKVIRNGITLTVPASELVVGDLIVVESGDTISADAKIIEAYNFYVVESSLTGESVAVEKNANKIIKQTEILAEKTNIIFSGTYSTNGRALAVVYSVGKKTEIGKINNLIQEQQVSTTPLQDKLNKMGKLFGWAGIILLFVSLIIQIVLINTLKGNWTNIDVYSNSLITAISLAVAAIPEGLVTFTTVLLAIGVSKMAKENAIIKSLPAIETLGSTNIICSDKTGTLTQNKMTVVDLFSEDKLLSETNDKTLFKNILRASIACSDAEINIIDNEFVEVGDPTETGIIRAGLDIDLTKADILDKYKKISSLPFDSERKLMSVLLENNSRKVMITKGAPDVIFNLTNADKKFIDLNEEWAKKAYRVIAVAKKEMSSDTTQINFKDEQNLEIIGLIALIDPPREEVKKSILECLGAGVKPVMITGDHITTAVAIAKNLHIFNEGDIALSGAELANLTDEELFNTVEKVSVYARVNPSDKLRIVQAWQKHNKVVAMTGDGVNDAPALKASDIGCAMGITGTDVSKQAADVILTDDNFNTITKAIRGGREIFDKIKTVILNLLISSVTEIIVMMIGLFVFRFAFAKQISDSDFWVLSASQLLWINLLTHGLPAIALGMVHNGDDVMNRKPFNKDESIFARGMGINLMIQSSVVSLLALLSYSIVALIATKYAITGIEFVKLTSTACFVTLGMAASLSSLNLISHKSIFKCNVRKFKLVYLASIFSLFCVILAAYVPGVRTVFKMYNSSTYPIELWLIPIALGFGLIIWNEISKATGLHAKIHKLNK